MTCHEIEWTLIVDLCTVFRSGTGGPLLQLNGVQVSADERHHLIGRSVSAYDIASNARYPAIQRPGGDFLQRTHQSALDNLVQK
jgi:hypothetical protein